MIDAVAAVFPKRPVHLKDKTGAFLPTMFIFLLCVAMGSLFLYLSFMSILPGIQRDWVIAKDAAGEWRVWGVPPLR